MNAPLQVNFWNEVGESVNRGDSKFIVDFTPSLFEIKFRRSDAEQVLRYHQRNEPKGSKTQWRVKAYRRVEEE